MNCSTKKMPAGRIEREINVDGVEYDRGSVYERFGRLTDIRKAKGVNIRLMYTTQNRLDVYHQNECGWGVKILV